MKEMAWTGHSDFTAHGGFREAYGRSQGHADREIADMHNVTIPTFHKIRRR